VGEVGEAGEAGDSGAGEPRVLIGRDGSLGLNPLRVCSFSGSVASHGRLRGGPRETERRWSCGGL
jgi:hypothetical protein